jgi:hypothetical protein
MNKLTHVKYREKRREYYLAHREEILAKAAARRKDKSKSKHRICVGCEITSCTENHCHREYKRWWRKVNRKKVNQQARETKARKFESRPELAAMSIESIKRWKKENPEKLKAQRRHHYANLKRDALEKYGTSCICCGESDIRFLTMDHKNNDGAEHRRQTDKKGNGKHGGGLNMYFWLRHNNYPDGFQTMCYNCNCARSRNGGICPHKDRYGEFTVVPQRA